RRSEGRGDERTVRLLRRAHVVPVELGLDRRDAGSRVVEMEAHARTEEVGREELTPIERLGVVDPRGLGDRRHVEQLAYGLELTDVPRRARASGFDESGLEHRQIALRIDRALLPSPDLAFEPHRMLLPAVERRHHLRERTVRRAIDSAQVEEWPLVR